MNFQTYHHLTAFNASIVNGASLLALAAISDPAFNIRNNKIIVPEDRRILAMYAQQDTHQIAALDSASLQLGGRPIISPAVNAVIMPTLAAVDHQGEGGPMMIANEDVGVVVSRGGAGAAISTVLIWHTKRYVPWAGGKSRTVRGASNAITVVAGAWTLGQISLDSSLAVGRYKVVGMRVIGTTLIAARLVIVNCPERPGCLGDILIGNFQLPGFRDGQMGEWGTFDHLNIPQIEVLSNTAGATTYEVHLDLVGPMPF